MSALGTLTSLAAKHPEIVEAFAEAAAAALKNKDPVAAWRAAQGAFLRIAGQKIAKASAAAVIKKLRGKK